MDVLARWRTVRQGRPERLHLGWTRVNEVHIQIGSVRSEVARLESGIVGIVERRVAELLQSKDSFPSISRLIAPLYLLSPWCLMLVRLPLTRVLLPVSVSMLPPSVFLLARVPRWLMLSMCRQGRPRKRQRDVRVLITSIPSLRVSLPLLATSWKGRSRNTALALVRASLCARMWMSLLVLPRSVLPTS